MDLFIRWANKLVDASLGDRINPSGIWVGLSTTVPLEDGSNWTEVNERSGYGGYARVSLATFIPPASNGLAMNNTVIDFPLATTGGAIIAAAALFSDPALPPSQAGRAFKAIQPGILVVAGRRIQIRASSLKISAS